MIVSTIQTSNCTPQTIVIGRRGTYDTMQIAFDLSYLVESYGNGVAVLAVKRSQDESAYPAVTSQEDDLLLWTVSETDTYYAGAGECQLMWYVDGGLAKTIIYPMVVMRDILATSEEAPDAYQEWVDDLTALGAETLENAQNAAQSESDAEDAKDDAVTAKEAAEAAQQAAETAVTHYPKIENNYWMVWDSATQQYVSTGIQAEGEDGYSPEVTITSIEGGHRVTITDKDHPQGQSFDVMDGQGGGGTSDYTDLTNKPSINNVTLTGNKTAADLGLGTYSKPSGGIPKTDLASDVQQSLGKADTALQTAPVSSVAGKTGAVVLDAGDSSFSDSETYASGSVGAELTDQKNAISQKAPVIINIASGDVASFADGADGMQIRKIVGTIVPQQAAGTPSPENPLPISGWTQAVFNHTKGNLAPSIPASGTASGITYTLNDDGTFTVNGTATGTAEILCGFLPIKWDGVTDYFLSGCPAGGANNKYFIRVNAVGSGSYSHYDVGNGIKLSNEYGTLVGKQIHLAFYVMSGVTVNNLVVKPMLNAGSSRIDYRPYTPTTIPVNWQTEAGTILGGTLTLNEDGSADLISDWIERTFQGNDSFAWGPSWNPKENTRGFIFSNTQPTIKAPINSRTMPELLCEDMPTLPYSGTGSISDVDYPAVSCVGADGASGGFGIAVRVADTSLSTTADVNAYLREHPVTVYYRTSNSSLWGRYHFDNIGSMMTYFGSNNIWIDTGAITECDYPADTKLYVDGLTAPDEDMIANANIASGKYFVVNNQLYLSTAAIAAGASIVPGTNCTATNLAEALNALNT